MKRCRSPPRPKWLWALPSGSTSASPGLGYECCGELSRPVAGAMLRHRCLGQRQQCCLPVPLREAVDSVPTWPQTCLRLGGHRDEEFHGARAEPE